MFGIRLVFDSSSCATWPLNPIPPADSGGLEMVADTEALQSSSSKTYGLVLSKPTRRLQTQLIQNFTQLPRHQKRIMPLNHMPAPFASKGPFTQMRIRKSCKTKIILMPTRVKIQPRHDFSNSKSLLASISQSQNPKFLKT
jgi:hypothetical protein